MRLLPLAFVALLIQPALRGQPQIITTFAGSGSIGFSGDGGPAIAATFNLPVFVASDAAGFVYIADQNNNRIRRVDLQGNVTTFAGNGASGFSGDGGPAVSASLNVPTGVFVDGLGNVFIADVGNQRIRKVDTGGNITTVAGNGSMGYSGDGGPATSAAFFNPVRVVVDNSGTLYIADQSNHRVRKVDSSGIVTTVAGTGTMGFSGDTGLATNAVLNNPTAIALDLAHNLFISDQLNHRIRKVDTAGKITTIAGNGVGGYSGDGGPATAASLNFPGGLIIDTTGNIFVADDVNYRVRQISPSGIITTVAGSGTQGFSGDGGPASAARLNGQFGLALDRSGNLIIADSANNRVRRVTLASPVTPVFPSLGVTSSASFLPGASPGELGTIFGIHLSTNLLGVKSATAVPLPVSLAGTSVTVNGIAAPLLAVANVAGQEQINFQMPWEVAGQSAVSIIVNNGVSSNTAVIVTLSVAQPGVFLVDGLNGAVEHLDGTLVTASNPAVAGEYIVVFGTGFGAVSPPLLTGQPAPASPVSQTSVKPTVTIGGIPATNVPFSGAAPFFVGLNQINVQVPALVPSGSQNLIVALNGVAANTAKIAIK